MNPLGYYIVNGVLCEGDPDLCITRCSRTCDFSEPADQTGVDEITKYVLLPLLYDKMVKTGQFTTKCKGNKVIALKQQISFSLARRLTELMAALTTEVTLKRDKAFYR